MPKDQEKKISRVVEQAVRATAEDVEFRPAPVNERAEEKRVAKGRPPLPSSMRVRPHIARSNQTPEQLAEERAWFEWMVANLTEAGAVDFASRELIEISAEEARRRGEPSDGYTETLSESLSAKLLSDLSFPV